MEARRPERRQYKNPPIEEALCAFHFVPLPEWDPTIPGRLYEQIKASYSGKPRTQTGVEAQVGAESAGSGSSLILKSGVARVQFPSVDGKALVGIGPDVLSIHVLRPYPKWEGFRPRIEEAIEAYETVDASRAVAQIGLRYINRIEIHSERVDLDTFFTIGPKTPKVLPESLASFFSRQEYVYEDKPIRLAITFANAQALKGHCAMILDLDLTLQLTPVTSLKNVMAMVDELRDRERIAFESLVTDEARSVFNAD